MEDVDVYGKDNEAEVPKENVSGADSEQTEDESV